MTTSAAHSISFLFLVRLSLSGQVCPTESDRCPLTWLVPIPHEAEVSSRSRGFMALPEPTLCLPGTSAPWPHFLPQLTGTRPQAELGFLPPLSTLGRMRGLLTGTCCSARQELGAARPVAHQSRVLWVPPRHHGSGGRKNSFSTEVVLVVRGSQKCCGQKKGREAGRM